MLQRYTVSFSYIYYSLESKTHSKNEAMAMIQPPLDSPQVWKAPWPTSIALSCETTLH